MFLAWDCTMGLTSRAVSQRSLLLWALLLAVSLAAGLGMRSPSPPDEPRFVLAARAMVESGQWLLPHRGSELYAEKPPVFMWMQATAYRLLGNWDIAFLLPSLMAALLTLWLTWNMARRLWNRRVASYAVLALFACLQFGLMAKRAQIDMVLLAMTTLSLWGLLRHLLRGPDWPALYLGAFAAGVGTVTKGVGFLPLLILLPWCAWRWHHRMPRTTDDTALRWLLLLPAFLAGTAVWLLPLSVALLSNPDPSLHAYAHELLFKQTGTRYAAAWHHHQPAWYYLQVMATLWLPGSLLLPWLAPAWWRRCRRGDPRYLLLLGWALLVLLFFSLSPGKREVYILPMLPALAVAAAPLLAGLLRRRNLQWLLLAYTAVLGAGASAIGISALTGSHWLQRILQSRAIDLSILPPLGYWLLGFGVCTLSVVVFQRRRAGLATVMVTALLWITYGSGLMPLLDPYSSSSAVMRKVAARIGPDAELGLVAWREQNLLQAPSRAVDFGFKRPVVDQWQDASQWLAGDPDHRWLFVLDSAMSACVDKTQLIDIGSANRNRWQLLPGTAMNPGCTTHFTSAAPAKEDRQ
jgi:4-amino-4-deoxy-L-arabinose transferase-like glycosyltransferase